MAVTLCRSEPEHPERWQRELGRVRQAVPRLVGYLNRSTVANTAAAELGRIGVEHLLPPPAERQADPVGVARYGRQAGDARHRLLAVGRVPQERQDVVV